MGVKVECVEDKVGEIGDKVQSVDESVQVVMDGAQSPSSLLPKPSNVYTSRRQASKHRGKGSRIDYPSYDQ